MRIKRGTTFAYTGTFPVLDAAGRQCDLTGWRGAAQLRRRNSAAELVEQLTFDWRDPVTGVFTVASRGTEVWPLETLDFDIVVISPDGVKIPTNTTQITVDREVTHA